MEIKEAEIGLNDSRQGTFTLGVCESCSKGFQRPRELAIPRRYMKCSKFHCNGRHTHSIILSLETDLDK